VVNFSASMQVIRLEPIIDIDCD